MNTVDTAPLFVPMLCSALAFLLVASSVVSGHDQRVWLAEHYLPVSSAEPMERLGDTGDVSGEQPERPSTWRRRCAMIAGCAGLSPRESEIFLLLAKGRNAEYVQNALHISPHTAKTHIANIYRKVNIHSAQGLLDLVESHPVDNGRVGEFD